MNDEKQITFGTVEYVACILRDEKLLDEIIREPEVKYFPGNDAWEWIIENIIQLKTKGIKADPKILKEQSLHLIADLVLQTQVVNCLTGVEMISDQADLTYWKKSIYFWLRKKRLEQHLTKEFATKRAKDWEESDVQTLERKSGLSSIFTPDSKLLFSYDDLDKSEREIVEEQNIQPLLNDRFLARQKSWMFYGETHIGKTSFLTQCMIYWALGIEAFGYTPPHPLSFLVVGVEDDTIEYQRIFKSVIKNGNLTKEQMKMVLENLVIPDVGVNDPWIITEDYLSRRQFDSFLLTPVSDFVEGGDTNSPGPVSEFVKKVNELKTKYKVAHIGIHHTNKMNTSKRRSIDPMYGYAGNGKFINSYRSSTYLARTSDPTLFTLTNVKSKAKAGFDAKHVKQSTNGDIYWYEPTLESVMKELKQAEHIDDVYTEVYEFLPTNRDEAVSYKTLEDRFHKSHRWMEDAIKKLKLVKPDVKDTTMGHHKAFYIEDNEFIG